MFTAQGSAPLKDWKVSGKPKKLYDKEVKSFIFELEGVSKMQIPKDERGALGLLQGFLALQVKIPPAKGFAVEIGVDTTRKRRRIVCKSLFSWHSSRHIDGDFLAAPRATSLCSLASHLTAA